MSCQTAEGTCLLRAPCGWRTSRCFQGLRGQWEVNLIFQVVHATKGQPYEETDASLRGLSLAKFNWKFFKFSLRKAPVPCHHRQGSRNQRQGTRCLVLALVFMHWGQRWGGGQEDSREKDPRHRESVLPSFTSSGGPGPHPGPLRASQHSQPDAGWPKGQPSGLESPLEP